MDKPDVNRFQRRAAQIRALKERIHRTFARDPHGPEHDAACDELHRRYDGLAFPGGLERGLALLRDADRDVIETWVRFLESDPRFFRSGYTKEKALRRLKHVALTRSQVRRLAQLVVRSVDGGGRREFHAYARLSGVLHAPSIPGAMRMRVDSVDPEVRRRAKDVLDIVEMNNKSPS